MKLEFSLSESDFLTNQLYFASKSKMYNSQGRKNRFYIILLPLFLSILFFLYGHFMWAFFTIVSGISGFVSYPSSRKDSVKRALEKYNLENYKCRFGVQSSIEFSDSQISIVSETIESKILVSEIECIYEIKNYIYLKLKMGDSLIIPKSKVIDLEDLHQTLKKVANTLSILYVEDTAWKW